MSDPKISYEGYRKTPEWIARRNKRLQDEPNCECCWARATMVHHLSYKTLWWDERDEDIVSICKDCHEKCHHVSWYKIKNEEEELRKRFEEIREENWYSRIESKKEERKKDDIENADSTTLVRLDSRFSKDKNHVYEYGKIIKNFDIATFDIIGNDYLKDKNGVYDSHGNLIKHDDWLSLEEISWDLCRDINHVYHSYIWEWNIIQWADSWSFEEVESPYFKDKNSLYKEYNGKIIKYTLFRHEYNDLGGLSKTDIYSPDLNSFEVINDDYTKDKNYIFFDRRILEWADPYSFNIVDWKKSWKDKNHEFDEYGIKNIFEKISLYSDEFFTTPDYKNVYKKITYWHYIIIAWADPKNFSVGFTKRTRDSLEWLFWFR